MKTELKAKFLQNILRKKKENEGFTLIELLVVIIIIGILSAIALPSFLNQANKARQSEAKTLVGSMNRAQQAYALENTAFASNDEIGKLGIGIKTQSENYIYAIDGSGSAVTNQARPVKEKAPIKAYVGGVMIGTIKATSESTSLAILCEADQALVADNSLNGEQKATFTGDSPTCPTDYSDASK
ncbi:MAG: type IV pilin-like G/H family protein [Cyanobacteria bacterium J06635_10]